MAYQTKKNKSRGGKQKVPALKARSALDSATATGIGTEREREADKGGRES